jgi:hypothetical protein
MRLICLLLLSSILLSCGSSKKVVKNDSTETREIVKTDTVYKEKVDTIRVVKTETKTETKTEVKFDTIQKDCPENKIIYRVNGDVEVSGAIKEFNRKESALKSKYDSLYNEYELERGQRFYYEDLSKQVKTVEVVKRGKWWIWFLIGFVLGANIGIYLYKKFKL